MSFLSFTSKSVSRIKLSDFTSSPAATDSFRALIFSEISSSISITNLLETGSVHKTVSYNLFSAVLTSPSFTESMRSLSSGRSSRIKLSLYSFSSIFFIVSLYAVLAISYIKKNASNNVSTTAATHAPTSNLLPTAVITVSITN